MQRSAAGLGAKVLVTVSLLVAGVVAIAAAAAAAAASATLALPAEIPVDTGSYDVPLTITNGSPGYAAVRISLAINGPTGLGADDLFVDVENPVSPGTFFGVPLSPSGAGDFIVDQVAIDYALPSSSTLVVNLRIATGPGAPGGALSMTATVRQVNSGSVGATIATATDTTTLKAPAVSLSTPPEVPALGSSELTVTAQNDTGVTYDDVEASFVLYGELDLTPDDVELWVDTGTGWGKIVPITQPLARKLQITIPLPNDQLPTGTTTFDVRIVRLATSTAGEYRTEAQVQTKSGAAGIGFGAGVAVFAGPVTLQFPVPSPLVVGAVAKPFTASIGNPTAITYSNLVIGVVITKPGGIDASDLALDYTRPGDATRHTLTLTASAGTLSGRMPIAHAVNLAAGQTADFGFRIRALPGLADGSVTISARAYPGTGPSALTTVLAGFATGTKPTIALTAPATAPRGGATRDLSIVFTNGTGATIDPARIDLRFDGPSGFDPTDISLGFDNPSTPAIDYAPTQLTTPVIGGVHARLPIPTGFTLAPGGATTYSLRLTTLVSAPLGTLNLTASLITADPTGSFVTSDPLATSPDTMTITAVSGATSTALAASPVPGRATQSQTLTATVSTADPDAPPITGSVTFKDGATVLGTANVGAQNKAVLTLPGGLTTGDRKLTAIYGGAAPLLTSTSPEITLLVTPPTLIGRYVDAVYRKILLRPAEPAGLAYWEDRMNHGLSRRAYADLLFKLTEPLTRLCDKIYLELVLRKGTTAERSACVTRLKNKERIPTVGSEVGGSAEFLTQAGGTNAGFIALLHTRVLRRSVTPTESSYWLGRLSAGTSRQAVALAVLTSDERYGLTVDDAYQLMLSRFSDAAGRQFWIDKMKAGVPETNLLAQLLGSPEYLATVP